MAMGPIVEVSIDEEIPRESWGFHHSQPIPGQLSTPIRGRKLSRPLRARPASTMTAHRLRLWIIYQDRLDNSSASFDDRSKLLS
jgi:hypothetical protein